MLTPPLGSLPQLKMASWRDDRLPEMLWAALVVGQLSQSEALAIFRPVAKFFHQFRAKKVVPCDVRISGLAQMQPEILEAFLENLMEIKGCREILRPLLLFRDLPARSAWEKAINLQPLEDDWNVLQRAVAVTLFHQSQEATDCRWVRLMCILCAGKLIMQSREQIEELINYPDVEMQKVRPTIRAMEGGLDANVKNQLPGIKDFEKLEICVTEKDEPYFIYSEELINKAILDEIDKSDHEKAFEKLMTEVMTITRNFRIFCAESAILMMNKYTMNPPQLKKDFPSLKYNKSLGVPFLFSDYK